mgnify:CR=1 FL=1
MCSYVKFRKLLDIQSIEFIRIMGEIDMNEKCVVLNAKKMNFDGKLDFSVLSSDVIQYMMIQQNSSCQSVFRVQISL